MPTLVRFTTILAALAAIVYGAMYLLVVTVEPRPRPMTVDVPLDRLRSAADQTSSTGAGEQTNNAAPADALPAETAPAP